MYFSNFCPLNEISRNVKTVSFDRDESNHPAHLRSLIRVFAVSIRNIYILGYLKSAPNKNSDHNASRKYAYTILTPLNPTFI